MPNLTLTFDPVTQNHRVPPLIMNNLHVKFESDEAKSIVCIVPTRQSATDRRTDRQTHGLTNPPHRITISPPTLLRGDNNIDKTGYKLGVFHCLFQLYLLIRVARKAKQAIILNMRPLFITYTFICGFSSDPVVMRIIYRTFNLRTMLGIRSNSAVGKNISFCNSCLLP